MNSIASQLDDLRQSVYLNLYTEILVLSKYTAAKTGRLWLRTSPLWIVPNTMPDNTRVDWMICQELTTETQKRSLQTVWSTYGSFAAKGTDGAENLDLVHSRSAHTPIVGKSMAKKNQ